MLQVYGHIYSDSQEKLSEIIKAIEENNFQIAYDTSTTVTIIKEVNEEEVK